MHGFHQNRCSQQFQRTLEAALHVSNPGPAAASHAQPESTATADLIKTTVKCFVFGDAATALAQVRAGTVIACRCRWDDNGRDTLKILDASNVTEVGVSADMGYCKGKTRGGEPCNAIVNKRLHGCYCDFHLKQVRACPSQLYNRAPRGTKLLGRTDGLQPRTSTRAACRGNSVAWRSRAGCKATTAASTCMNVAHARYLAAVSSIPHESSRRRACLLYTSPSPRDRTRSRMPSSA